MYCNFIGRMYVIVCNVMYKIGEENKIEIWIEENICEIVSDQAKAESWMPETRIISCLVGSPHILHVARGGWEGGVPAGEHKISFILPKTTFLKPL